MELVCGGAATVVYGDTESPYEAVFKNFAEVWNEIDTVNYDIFTSKSRKLNGIKETVLDFLYKWLEDSKNIREDYRKLAELSVLFLGGAFPQEYNFTFKAPGAFHHARWMAQVIYTIQIALFRCQLSQVKGFTQCSYLDNIYSLASFLTIFYVKYWFKSPNTFDAAVNDLEMWNAINEVIHASQGEISTYPNLFYDMSVAAQNKLNSHLWYLTERHVVLAFASDRVPLTTKVQMWKKLQSYRSSCKRAVIGKGLVQMPVLKKSTRLPDLIGSDSFELFKVLPQFECLTWINPRLWSEMEEFALFQSLLQNIPCTNDAVERVLGMVTNIELRQSAPKSEAGINEVIKITYAYRCQVRKAAKQSLTSKKANTTSKEFLKDFKW